MSYNYGGYRIYDEDEPNVKYYFNKSSKNAGTAQYTLNQNRQELVTFGRVPFVYYAGETYYTTIKLDTIFVDNYYYDENNNLTTLTVREQVNNFKALLKKRIPLVLENSQGEKFMVDVVIDNESTPINHVEKESLNYIEMSITCTDIGVDLEEDDNEDDD